MPGNDPTKKDDGKNTKQVQRRPPRRPPIILPRITVTPSVEDIRAGAPRDYEIRYREQPEGTVPLIPHFPDALTVPVATPLLVTATVTTTVTRTVIATVPSTVLESGLRRRNFSGLSLRSLEPPKKYCKYRLELSDGTPKNPRLPNRGRPRYLYKTVIDPCRPAGKYGFPGTISFSDSGERKDARVPYGKMFPIAKPDDTIRAQEEAKEGQVSYLNNQLQEPEGLICENEEEQEDRSQQMPSTTDLDDPGCVTDSPTSTALPSDPKNGYESEDDLYE